MANKTKIIKNMNLDSYKKKYGRFSYKLVKLTKKDVSDFEKLGKGSKDILFKGHNWALIGDTYYQLPKPGFSWFRNMNAAGKTAMCLLGAGVVGGAVATPIVINNARQGTVDVVKGEGIKNVTQRVDAEGNTNITVETEENFGVNKDVVEVYMDEEQVEEDEFEIDNDDTIILSKKMQEKHKGKKMRVNIKRATRVSTPEKFLFTAAKGQVEVNADAQGEICIPAQVNGVKVTKVDTRKMQPAQRELVTKLTLSNNITELMMDKEEGATPPFAYFSNMTDVRMSDRMEKLPMGCFGMCNNLKNFKGGMRIKELHEGCFYGCERLQKVTLKQCNAVAREVFCDNQSLEEATFSDELTMFGESAFDNCYSLKTFALPPKVEMIGKNAFRNCHKLNKMTFPKSLGEKVAFGAFANNFSLREMHIDSAYMAKCEMNQDFHGAYHNAEKIYIKKGLSVGAAINRNFVRNEKYVSNDYDMYEPNTDKDCLSFSYYVGESYDSKKCAVKCQKSAVKKGVLTLQKEMETKDVGTQRLMMLNSYGCANNKDVETVNFPTYDEEDTDRFVSIGSDFDHGYSFYMCDQLKKVENIKHVKRICGHSFHGCSALERFDMPDELEWIDNPEGGSGYFNIGPEAFAGCNKMKNLYFSIADSQIGAHRPFDVDHNNWKIFKHGQKVHVPSGQTLLPGSFLQMHGKKDTQLSNETYDVYTMDDTFEE